MEAEQIKEIIKNTLIELKFNPNNIETLIEDLSWHLASFKGGELTEQDMVEMIKEEYSTMLAKSENKLFKNLIKEPEFISLDLTMKSTRSLNELEMLAEDLECIEMWLDKNNVPTHDDSGNKYSHIGRIEQLVIGFSKWLKNLDNGTEHYNHYTKEKTESIGISPYDCFIDDIKTIEELYNIYKSQIK